MMRYLSFNQPEIIYNPTRNSIKISFRDLSASISFIAVNRSYNDMTFRL